MVNGQSMIPTRFVQSGDVRLAVYTWGKSHGAPPVLLVHGYPDSARVFEAVAKQLSRDHFVIAYDVRGAGRSTRPSRTEDYSLPLLAADLEAVVSALSPQRKVHVVGHDWGSIQSWQAVTEPRVEARLASFTTISGPCLDHVGYWLKEQLAEGSVEACRTLVRQLRRSWYIGFFHLPRLAPLLWKVQPAQGWAQALERREGLVGVEPSPTQRLDGATGVHLYRANVLPRLKQPEQRRTRLPVQLITPTRDAYVAPELSTHVGEWAPTLTRVEMDAGHWLPLSHPDALANHVRRFVAEVEAGAPLGASVGA